MKKTDYISPKVELFHLQCESGFAQSGSNFEQPQPGSIDPFSDSAWD